jgi:tetratricopeptide (TPR) repeat protein
MYSIWRACAVAALILANLAILGCDGAGLDQEAVATNNRGVALMGRFDYEAARVEFDKVAQRYPDEPDVQVNLAIAILNRQGEGDEELALSILAGVLEKVPDHARALYCSGLLELHKGEPEKALERFRRVSELDPDDADAAYNVGQCLMQQGKPEEALPWYERAIKLDPYLRSAYYTAFQAKQRLGKRDEARDLLDTFKLLEDNPRVRLVEFKYTKMGAKGNALALDQSDSKPRPVPQGPLFAGAVTAVTVEELQWRDAVSTASITACDLNGDERTDLLVAGALATADGAANAVLLANGAGFELAADHPLASVSKVNTALWGDIDNDGLTDVYLCRQGTNQLWRQPEPGQWLDVTAETGTGNGELDTVDGAIFDADHDGDLDLFLINADGANELLNNNRDGSFKPLAGELGLTGSGAGRSLVLADIDSDRDVDLIMINRQPPHQVFRNHLMWEYQPAPGFDALSQADVAAAAAGDLDADGKIELYTVDSAGELRFWQADGEGVWQPDELSRSKVVAPLPGPARIELADLDGDGSVDIVTSGDKGLQLYAGGDANPVLIDQQPEQQLVAWSLVATDPGQGPSLVGWSSGASPVIWKPGGGRHPFVALRLSGQEDASGSVRSNASGIGAEMALRTGSQWSVVSTLRQGSGPGQSLQPVMIGLGGAERIDFVAIDWSDGVYQTELDLAKGETHLITETQRQLSSCPVLFAWNGERYEFVTDFLGVGGIGYAMGPPGQYGEPRPWENLLLSSDQLSPRDGALLLKLTEPMEEITYVDTVRLTAYDLPPGWSMTLDERMGISGPQPTGRVVLYRHQVAPVRAVNNRGEEVTGTVLTADRKAAPVGELDHRFIGRLEESHQLTVTFAEPLDGHPGKPVLVADGWVEYPYSQTNFAAWQAGAQYLAPTLSALAGNGRWQVLLEQLGYPAGMPRQMSLPLANLPPGTRQLRLETNQEVYWDRLVVAYEEPCPEVRSQQLQLTAADLRQTGFARRHDAPQRVPSYDYSRRAPRWDTRHMAGWYTEMGPITELVDSRDGAVAIFGPGEEIHLQFEAPEAELPEGWQRVYVLESEGWCKDMDLYTKDGATVGPIPGSDRGGAERERLHKAYNTRYMAGRD